MLQSDRLIWKGTDSRRLLEHHMAMWQNGQFDALLQEAAVVTSLCVILVT